MSPRHSDSVVKKSEDEFVIEVEAVDVHCRSTILWCSIFLQGAAMADPSSPAHEISSIPSKSSRPPMEIKATAVGRINDRSPPVAHLKSSAIEPDQRPDPASSRASTPNHAPITHQPSHPASNNPKSSLG
ncbi:hypothetical protein ACLOJK_018964 [Asimina triloba]